ncbi:Wzz/FepE/Etk N-terminal domain-containing protein [Loigolactobacillus coryniformis]|uniref:YveK family protein n=1 Tax=Loigolactobacillus coryniformis TaxID=1610 RepID=UPI00233FBF12|nr:Wzz/FepE/Etk N-terminal domain-containing protein [Loigolactobacillus coryniformis]MDC4186163.1 Wzz/FepE/Etk N-terminal domain-containing protein [Loigolactobacillus coryniformis]
MQKVTSLPALVRTLWQRKYWFVLGVLVCAGIGFLIGNSTYTPYYTAEAQLKLPHEKVRYKRNQSFSDATAIGVYRIQALDQQVLVPVQRHLAADFNLSVTLDNLKEQIHTIPPSDGSMILRIQAQAQTPRQAMLIANTHLIVFTTKVKQFNHLKKVQIYQFAALRQTPANQPNTKKYTVYGGIVGLLLVSTFIIWRQYIQTDRR